MEIFRKYINVRYIGVFLLLFISILSCEKDDEKDVLFTGDSYENIMQYIENNRSFESFVAIVNAGKMNDVLSSYNSNGGIKYTLFLPTNEAIDKFFAENDIYANLDELLQDVNYCKEIVRYHLVNGQIASNEFPNGVLADKTISNYYLTIFFREGDDGDVSFSVNDESKVLTTDVVLDNGIIHTIDKMLTPIVFTSFQWIEKRSEYDIFTQLMVECGLEDTLNAYELDELGREVYNDYTLFAESNSLYATNNINSFNDLVTAIDPSGTGGSDYTNMTNPVNKYARYHILEKSVFLDEFTTKVYNTYGDLPVSVNLDSILKVNMGTMAFDTIVTGNDTVVVDYLQIYTEESNIVTRSGAIHQLDHLLFPYLPSRSQITYQFYEEPMINALRDLEGEHYLDNDELDYIDLVGTTSLQYINLASELTNVSNNDYIKVSGNFEFTFVTPKILAGRYNMRLVLDRGSNSFASVQAFVDSKKVGVVVDARKVINEQPTGFNNADANAIIGTVEFNEYGTHVVQLKTVIPGSLSIDRIIFTPN